MSIIKNALHKDQYKISFDAHQTNIILRNVLAVVFAVMARMIAGSKPHR